MVKKNDTSAEVEEPEHIEPETVEDESEAVVGTEPEVAESQPRTGFKQKLAAFGAYYKSHKKLMIPATVVLILGLLLVIPPTRYALLGTVIKKQVSVKVTDSKTEKAVSGAEVRLAGKQAQTDQNGVATLSGVPVGSHQATVTKKYYTDATSEVFVKLSGSSQGEVKLNATGRQVKAKVANKLSGKAIEGAVVSAADTTAKTDENGETTIVLPADKDTQDVTVTADGFNKLTGTIKVTESDTVLPENNFMLTPTGKVYFLSKRTGKINVMKSDLDGANPEVVLAATGDEDDGDTILLASQDWKYLALKSKRSGSEKPASLYLIDTSNGDKLTTMDEGDATFTMIGWSGHTFTYQVQRDKVQFWQPNKYSLKSYNAENGKLTVLDNTAGEGTGASSYQGTDYKSEYFGNVILVGSTVTYTKSWYSGIYYYGNTALAGKQNGIYSVNVDGSSKKQIKGFDATTNSSIEGKLYEPKEVYYRVYTNDKADFYELENGTLSPKGDLSSTFNGFYPTYLISPSNNKTFWSEPRDGKNTLFIGNADGDDEKAIAEIGEYTAYGWYTDDYVLLSKNSSELYVIGAAEFGDRVPLKITDYHKPNTTFYGYGGGYGGL